MSVVIKPNHVPKLKSGHTVYRVSVWQLGESDFNAESETIRFQGKKHHGSSFFGPHSGVVIRTSGDLYDQPYFMTSRKRLSSNQDGQFVYGVLGRSPRVRTFFSKRKADQFARLVNEGRFSEILGGVQVADDAKDCRRRIMEECSTMLPLFDDHGEVDEPYFPIEV